MKLIDILVEELPKNGGWPDGIEKLEQYPDGSLFCGTKYKSDFKFPIVDDYGDDEVTRAEYEAALAVKNEGWIEWGGGECPVNPSEMVDVIFGHGGRMSTNIADCWRWNHGGTDSDIIAYRLHKPQEAAQPKADDEVDLNECIGQDAAQVLGGEGKPAIGEKCEHHSGGQWEAVTIAGIYENLVTGFTDYWMVKEDGSSYTVGNPYRFRPILSEAERKRDEAVAQLNNFVAMGKFALDEDLACAVYDAIAAGKIPGVKLDD